MSVPFGSVAECAGVAEIPGVRLAAVLLSDHVIHLASQIRVVRVDQAVFAEAIRPRFDQPAKVRRNIAGHCTQSARARALANRIRCSSFRK